MCKDRQTVRPLCTAPHRCVFWTPCGNGREGVRLPRTTQVYVQSSYASQLSAHTTNPRLSSCYFKHTVGKRSKHCQYSLDNQNQDVIRRGEEGRGGQGRLGKLHADNVWKHWEQRSRRTVPSAWGLAIVSSSSCQLLPVRATVEIVFTVVFLIPIFLSFFFLFGAIYRVGCRGLGRRWRGGWTVELFGSLPVSGFRSGRAWLGILP